MFGPFISRFRRLWVWYRIMFGSGSGSGGGESVTGKGYLVNQDRDRILFGGDVIVVRNAGG